MNIVKTEIEGVLIIEHASSATLVATSSRASASESLKKGSPNPGTQCSLLPRQRVNEQLWCDARSALPVPTLYPEQVGMLRKR